MRSLPCRRRVLGEHMHAAHEIFAVFLNVAYQFGIVREKFEGESALVI